VVSRRPNLTHDSPRDRTPDRRVKVRGEPPLRLDRREVLHLVARATAKVLPEPVDELREVQRVERG
jgi:hypothetical protein